jgi:uncharacterized membrane protein YccC
VPEESPSHVSSDAAAPAAGTDGESRRAPAGRRLRLQVSDPDHQLLHRGLRTTIGQFSAMVVGILVLDNDSFTLFAAFGSFAVLALAELGGRRSARPRAYAVLTAAGAIGIAAGTLASQNVVAGALVLLVGVFALQFATVFGGYIAAAEPAVLLMFVLGVMVPGAPTDIVPREVGWLAACALSTVLALALWPPPDARLITGAYAAICRSIASVLRGVGRRPATPSRATPLEHADARAAAEVTADVTVGEVAAAMRATREQVLAQPTRPAGPNEHDQALRILSDELNRAISMLGRLEAAAASGPAPIAPAQRELGDVVASAFDASAEGLERREPPAVSPLEIDHARDRHLEALAQWVEHEVEQCDDPTPIMATARRVFPLRVLSLSAVSINANVSILGGMEVDTDPLATVPHVPDGSGTRATWHRARGMLADHLHPNAVWFRNSARAAVSLALALCVAQLGGFEHAFWIVLGALSVLRSNAIGTSRTAIEAILGSLLGFVAAALVLTVAGTNTLVLWAVLPFAIFLSAYTPKAVHFVIGQASFALLVVVLFNLLAPLGIVTALQRVQNVMIGAAVSVVIAVVFWPRGAGAALRDSLASLYHADSVFLAGAVEDMLAPAGTEPATSTSEQRARDLAAARRQSNTAYATYLNERGSKRMEREDWGSMFGVATGVRLVGDSIEQLALFGYSVRTLDAPRLHDAKVALHAAWRERTDELDDLARALIPPSRIGRTGAPLGPPAAPRDDPTPVPSRDELDAVVATALRDAHRADDLRPALGLVFLTAWLGVVDHLIATIRAPVARAQQTNARPWYR